ncbi:MAG: DUF5103 domain-containing protein [Bacteroidales bacterium]|nr:DUF5103 domain-containing protein [Bacteroidales bacterium]MDZ4203575.1 DUF5103 domain-containing protein [Bacteroidales bacterium]
MSIFRFLFFLFITLTIPLTSFIVSDNGTNRLGRGSGMQEVKFQDEIYKSTIRTVRFHRLGQEMAMPVIALNSNEQLQLSFDDLDGQVKNYKYTFIHCNSHWQPSELWKSDYISGFTEDYINNYRFSFNTLQPYVHYQLVFPNRNMLLSVPGNYLMIVFQDNDPNAIILTRRFMILDQKVTVVGRIRMPMAGADRLKKHEIGFTIETGNFPVIDPQRNLRVVVIQNGRWDNALELQPMMIRGSILDYQYVDGSNTFDAINEFRGLDLRSVKYLVGNISEIGRDDLGYDIHLWPDKRRNFKPYVHEKDLNGRYDIGTNETSDPDVEAEYVKVHFTLEVENAIPGADVYISGMLSDWQFRDENRMRYNSRRSVYEKSILLKQGYYNYHYTLLNHGVKMGNSGFFEGNHADTGNEYTIFVYYRQPGSRSDNLISIKTLNSKDFL